MLMNYEIFKYKAKKKKKQTPVNAYRSLLQNYKAFRQSPFHSNFTKHLLLQTQPLLTRLNDDTLLKPHLEF